MARVALVTGGTRGIGAAIAKALKAGGYKVAANYGGNDEAAQKFKTETGIPVYKWDVSSYEACAEGIKRRHIPLEYRNPAICLELLRSFIIAAVIGRNFVPARLESPGDCRPDPSSSTSYQRNARHDIVPSELSS